MLPFLGARGPADGWDGNGNLFMVKRLFLQGSGDGSLIRLFAFEDAVDDSIWDSGESGELAEAGSLFETGKYYLSA